MPVHVRRRRRLAALAATAVAAATLQTAFAPPAEAGQVGVTVSIQGAGKVTVVEGSLEDDGSTVCDWSTNQDDDVTNTCARLRNQEPFEAWVWLRAEAASSPAGHWRFEGWSGCDAFRDRDGRTECAVHSGAFSSDERSPKAIFRDRVAPLVTSGSAQQLTGASRRVRFTFAADEGATQCRLLSDGAAAPFVPCASPTDLTVRWGDDQLQVRGVDPSGNVGPVRGIDAVGVATLLYPGPGANTRSRTVTFDFQGVDGGEFLCSLDYAAFTSCGSGEVGTITYSDLADASHHFQVYARKGAFSNAAHPSTYSWRVDTVAPVTPLTPSIAGDGATFVFPASNTVKQECRLSRPGSPGAWATCVSPVSYAGLADGAYTFEVRSTDAAGNVESPPARHAWSVDRAAPDTTVTGPAGFVLASSATLGIGSDESGATFSCTLDGVARACGPGPLALTGLGRQTHVLTAAAKDRAGNADPTPALRSWTVPLTAADLGRGKGWKLKRSAAAYGGAFLQATRKGAALSRSVTAAREVALVVGKGRKLGTVKVYAGARLLGTVRLAARGTSARQLVRVATFATPFTGSLRIVVATQDRQVRIEGLGVATR